MGEIYSKLEKGITGAESPVLRINLTGIRDRKAVYRNLPEQSPSLKRIRTTSVHAQCLLTIWPASFSKKEDLTVLVKQSKSCIIEAGTKESGERIATITMESPFFVRLDDLLITGQGPPNGYSTHKYDMQMSLLPANATDPWPPIDFLAPPPKVSERMEADGPVRFPMLLAKWRKLPQLPETSTESLLEGLAYQDGKRYKTKLSLKLEAAWGSPPSQLALYNASRRKAAPPMPHLSSPISDHDTLGPIISVIWIFQGLYKHMKPIEFDGYLCPLCERRQSVSMDTYDFHLATGHDLFKFKLVSRTSSAGTRRKIDLEVLVDVTDTFGVKASNNALDQREMNWQKPQTLFDLEAFLKGDEAWIGRENRSNIRLVLPRPTLGSTPSHSGDSPQIDMPIVKRSRAVEEVPDLLPPDRKKFAVPPAPPGIKFFRLTVKRPLREGEYISESDDEMDGTWLLQKHNDTIESFSDMSQSEKQFIQRYDKHMLGENLSSNLHFREALVRFCRLNREWLQGREMNVEFYKNAARLLLQGVISPQLYRDCANIICAKQPIESKVGITDVSEDESQKAKRSKSINFQSPASKAKPTDSREKLRSPTEADCNAPDFHLKCVGLAERIPEWLCPSCEESSQGRNGTLSSSNIVTRRGLEGFGQLQPGKYGPQTLSTDNNDSTSTYVRQGLTGLSRKCMTSVEKVAPKQHAEAAEAQNVGESLLSRRKEIPGASLFSRPYDHQGSAKDIREVDKKGESPRGKYHRNEIPGSDSDAILSDDSPEYSVTDDEDTGYEDVDDDSSDQEHDLMMSEEERMLEDNLNEGAPKNMFSNSKSARSEIMDQGP
ncbi:hypothetical protein MMC26_003623 [Xylographa opegraphella]|nr:hypothetical protein [Xylographa opegraphella]